jgi:hypothetical protein
MITKATIDQSEYKKVGDFQHIITHATIGFMQLPEADRQEILKAFHLAKKGDWFYCIELDDTKVYACENGQNGYTIMLPSEY